MDFVAWNSRILPYFAGIGTMGMSPFVRTVHVFAVWMIVSTGTLHSTAWCADQQSEINGFVERWKTASAAIGTARVKCNHFSFSAHHSPDSDIHLEKAVESSLTPDEFRLVVREKLLPLVGKAHAFESMQQVIEAFLKTTGRGIGSEIDLYWSELAIVEDGAVIKNDEQYSQNHSIRKLMSDKLVSYDAHENLGLIEESEGRLDVYSVRNLRFVPDNIPLSSIATLKLKHIEGNHKARIFGHGVEIDFEPDSGFITHLVAFDESTGAVVSEVIQALPKKFAGGVEAPSISASASYVIDQNGEPRLHVADVFIIRTAEFNQKIAPSELGVPAPQGATIRDLTVSDRAELLQHELVAEHDVADISLLFLPPVKRVPSAVQPATLPNR